MILSEVRHYVAEQTLVPTVPLEDLKQHADKLVAALNSKEIYRDYIGILINKNINSSIHYHRSIIFRQYNHH